MSVITDTVTEFETRAFDAYESVQEPIVDVVRQVAEYVGNLLPEDRPSLPFADTLPSVTEVIESQFALAQKMLDANHRFAKALVSAAAPLLGEQPVAKPRATTKKAASAA